MSRLPPALLRLARCRSGTAAVETALLLPLLLLLILGAMEFGRMAWAKATLTYAVQEAARCASVQPTVCGSAAQIQAFAVQRAAPLIVPASAFTVATQACGSMVSADVTHGFILYTLAPSAPHITASVCRA
jgi:Flp pilus assembly protein TadG